MDEFGRLCVLQPWPSSVLARAENRPLPPREHSWGAGLTGDSIGRSVQSPGTLCCHPPSEGTGGPIPGEKSRVAKVPAERDEGPHPPQRPGPPFQQSLGSHRRR